MDFDLFWALGGWFILLSADCMAAITSTTTTTTTRTRSTSSSSSSSGSSTGHDQSCSPPKSQTLLLFLSLVFMVLLLSRPADHLISMSSTAPSSATRRLLSAADSSHKTSHQSNTMNFHPQQTSKETKHSTSSSSYSSSATNSNTSRQFGASAHEVPSGPNPISNR